MENKEIAIIERESNSVLDQAKKLEVKNQKQYEFAADFLKGVKELKRKVEETFKPIVKKAHEAWKEAKNQENKHMTPLDEAERIIKQASIEYLSEQDRILREEERKAREKAAAEEAKRKAELERQAKAHEEKGNIEKAEERRAMAEQVFVPVAPAQTEIQKDSAQSIREIWKAEVVDLNALVKAVASGSAPASFVVADMVAINKQARATKDTFKVHGVRFYAEKTMAVR